MSTTPVDRGCQTMMLREYETPQKTLSTQDGELGEAKEYVEQ